MCKAVSMLALPNCDMTERYRVLVGQLQFKPRELFPLLTAQVGSLHTSTSKHRKSIRKPGVLRAEMMEESESGQKPGESGVRKGNPG